MGGEDEKEGIRAPGDGGGHHARNDRVGSGIVGQAQDFSSLKSTTLVEKWDGTRWRIVPSPNPGGADQPNELNAVDAASPTAVWAVGGAGFPERGLILRWNGLRWKPVRNPCGV